MLLKTLHSFLNKRKENKKKYILRKNVNLHLSSKFYVFLLINYQELRKDELEIV